MWSPKSGGGLLASVPIVGTSSDRRRPRGSGRGPGVRRSAIGSHDAPVSAERQQRRRRYCVPCLRRCGVDAARHRRDFSGGSFGARGLVGADHNPRQRVFRRRTGQARRVPELWPRVDIADGRYVLFDSRSPGLVPGDGPDSDTFIRDRWRQTTSLASVHDGLPGDYHADASISIDGRFVGFSLYTVRPTVPPYFNRYDAYVRDTRTRRTSRLLPLVGGQPVLDSQAPSISRDGRYVAFVAWQVPGRERRFNILVRDRRHGTTRLISRAFDGGPSNGRSHSAAISANGRYIAFSSNAPNLVRFDANGHHSDVYVYDRRARRVVWTTATSTVEYIRPRRRSSPTRNCPRYRQRVATWRSGPTQPSSWMATQTSRPMSSSVTFTGTPPERLGAAMARPCRPMVVSSRFLLSRPIWCFGDLNQYKRHLRSRHPHAHHDPCEPKRVRRRNLWPLRGRLHRRRRGLCRRPFCRVRFRGSRRGSRRHKPTRRRIRSRPFSVDQSARRVTSGSSSAGTRLAADSDGYETDEGRVFLRGTRSSPRVMRRGRFCQAEAGAATATRCGSCRRGRQASAPARTGASGTMLGASALPRAAARPAWYRVQVELRAARVETVGLELPYEAGIAAPHLRERPSHGRPRRRVARIIGDDLEPFV